MNLLKHKQLTPPLINLSIFVCVITKLVSNVQSKNLYVDDICGHINGKRIYLEYGENGVLAARFDNHSLEKFNNTNKTKLVAQRRCTVEFVTCASCIMQIQFKFLNISQDCGRSTVFDSCGCDYVWIYEPAFEQSTGEQFCGQFIESNVSTLNYHSQTRKVVVTFFYNRNYGHAFTLKYVSEGNKVYYVGYPRYGNINNSTQIISSPYFPNLYPSDLIMENTVRCENNDEICRISLVFTDFLLDSSSIIELFDWNGERNYVTNGDVFRPPIIISSGPSLTIRFYANGASSFGYRAHFSFILGNLNNTQIKPDIDCGGHVNNLGGGITMMNMIQEGSKPYDCIWLIKPPESHFHMKTHLYVKVATFKDFVGNTDLTIRQGLTSNGPIVESLKLPISQFYVSRVKEHVVPISQGFYVNLKGLFRPDSRLAIVYAAFSYKDCLSGSDFPCHNLRCISSLLNCDGFDHCGDNSDEVTESCSKDPKDRRYWSQTPHFLFPSNEKFSDLTASAAIFLMCSFGFIGLIFATAILLYRMNLRTRNQRRIQDHIETINAILEEEVVVEVEEEIIIPDDPPDYEAPPSYEEVVKFNEKEKQNTEKHAIYAKTKARRCSRCNLHSERNLESTNLGGTSRSCQTTPLQIPDSPPPAYDKFIGERNADASQEDSSRFLFEEVNRLAVFNSTKIFNNIGLALRKASKKCRCKFFVKSSCQLVSSMNETTAKYFSDSELVNYSSAAKNVGARFICGRHLKKLDCFEFGRNFTTDDINVFM